MGKQIGQGAAEYLGHTDTSQCIQILLRSNNRNRIPHIYPLLFRWSFPMLLLILYPNIVYGNIYSRAKRFFFSRLRGGRPLRGAAPKGLVPLESLFRLRAGIGASTVAATPCPPRQNGGGAGGSLRQIFLTASITGFFRNLHFKGPGLDLLICILTRGIERLDRLLNVCHCRQVCSGFFQHWRQCRFIIGLACFAVKMSLLQICECLSSSQVLT